METPDINGYMYTWQLVDWAQANLNIMKPKEALTNAEIRDIMRWIGMCSVDTIFSGGDKPVLGRIGIGLMLTVTLAEFPEYYVKYELAQFN
ncbi:hypothetical protein ACFLYF_03735 [Chloroflexota bacterium]